MGALPKRKISKARRDRRRGADKLKAPVLSTCPKCGAKKLSHFRCPNCGHYGKLDSSTPAISTKRNKKQGSTKQEAVKQKAKKAPAKTVSRKKAKNK